MQILPGSDHEGIPSASGWRAKRASRKFNSKIELVRILKKTIWHFIFVFLAVILFSIGRIALIVWRTYPKSHFLKTPNSSSEEKNESVILFLIDTLEFSLSRNKSIKKTFIF